MIIKYVGYKRMKSCRYLLEYVLQDENKTVHKNGKTFVLTNNLKGQSIDEWVAEFEENEKHRKHKRKNNIRVSQEIITFHKGDSQFLTLKKLEKLTKEYMRRRNPNAVWIAAPHFDKHWHVHVIVAGVEYRTGKSLRMSREEYANLKKGVQDYQLEKYPELYRSIVRHGRKGNGQISEREFQLKRKSNKKTRREEISEIVRTCLAQTQSQQELILALRNNNLEVYYRNGRLTGVRFKNMKVRLSRLNTGIENKTCRKQRERKKQVRRNFTTGLNQ